MKIYFAGSIRGGREDAELYMRIIELLSSYGTVLTEHVGDRTMSSLGEHGPKESYIFERDIAWVNESDVIVAEVTRPSLGVGYELAYGEHKGKKIMCLYRPEEGRSLSAMIRGNVYFNIFEYYNIEELKAVFESELKS